MEPLRLFHPTGVWARSGGWWNRYACSTLRGGVGPVGWLVEPLRLFHPTWGCGPGRVVGGTATLVPPYGGVGPVGWLVEPPRLFHPTWGCGPGRVVGGTAALVPPYVGVGINFTPPRCAINAATIGTSDPSALIVALRLRLVVYLSTTNQLLKYQVRV